MKVLMWGAASAVLFLLVWTIAHVVNSPMPLGFAQMQPVGIVGAGFFWGVVLCVIRDKLGGRNG